MALNLEIDTAIYKYGLPMEWPDAVISEANQLSSEILKKDKHNRIDFREHPLITIDDSNAQDYDDAVCCQRTPSGWKLLVAIADVSAYVISGSALDNEACLRGNSIYFPDRVIPMLPESLSNGLCSLNPQEDRLCLVCEMLIDKKGEIAHSRFIEGIMRSQARLTYDELAAIVIMRDTDIRGQYKAFIPHLEELYQLYKILKRARVRRGAIQFNQAETRIVFNSEKKIEHLELLVRGDAQQMIEEYMIAANVAAGRFLQENKAPILYRTHDGPTADKLENLRTFLRRFGIRLSGGEYPKPAHYTALLKRVAKRADDHLIETALLRSLSRAVYHPKNTGHFGLSLNCCYTHFTSPIRRYPDLLIQRGIRHIIRNGNCDGFNMKAERLKELSTHCSLTECRADGVMRDIIYWLKCEYMVDKVGKTFPAKIKAVTSFGLFVELDDIYIEGLVHISRLYNDYYHFDPIHHRLQGKRNRRTYQLSESIKVRLIRINSQKRKIDFEPA
uniref:exoribonuclease II n=1 Tax=Candidatus Kentrum sp. TUN TaxID=2126343 RepID=A0A450ZAK4_9GAMM|nr:MAG: ribonuclease R [Candidatus Kentron sp. TUN]